MQVWECRKQEGSAGKQGRREQGAGEQGSRGAGEQGSRGAGDQGSRGVSRRVGGSKLRDRQEEKR